MEHTLLLSMAERPIGELTLKRMAEPTMLHSAAHNGDLYLYVPTKFVMAI